MKLQWRYNHFTVQYSESTEMVQNNTLIVKAQWWYSDGTQIVKQTYGNAIVQ